MHFPRRDICLYLWSRNSQLQKLQNYSLPCMTMTEEKQVKKMMLIHLKNCIMLFLVSFNPPFPLLLSSFFTGTGIIIEKGKFYFIIPQLKIL